MNIRNIKDRLISLLADKSSGIQPEFQKQLSEIIKHIEELLRDNHGKFEIPDELIKEIARCLIPDIIRFLESDKGKEEFEKWKNQEIPTMKVSKKEILYKKVDKISEKQSLIC